MRSPLFRWALVYLFTLAPIEAQTTTYPGTPVLTENGPLSCGIRMYSAGAVQSYCFYMQTGVPPVTVCNSLSAPVNAAPALPSVTVTPWNACYVYDPPTAQVYNVMWWVYRQGNGDVGYQSAFQALPCAPPVTSTGTTPAVCQYQIITQAPASNLTTGTLH